MTTVDIVCSEQLEIPPPGHSLGLIIRNSRKVGRDPHLSTLIAFSLEMDFEGPITFVCPRNDMHKYYAGKHKCSAFRGPSDFGVLISMFVPGFGKRQLTTTSCDLEASSVRVTSRSTNFHLAITLTIVN